MLKRSYWTNNNASLHNYEATTRDRPYYAARIGLWSAHCRTRILSSNVRYACQDQTAVGGTGDVAVCADGSLSDVELTGEGVA